MSLSTARPSVLLTLPQCKSPRRKTSSHKDRRMRYVLQPVRGLGPARAQVNAGPCAKRTGQSVRIEPIDRAGPRLRETGASR